MARMHRGILIGTGLIVGIGILGASAVGYGGGALWGMWRGEEEKPKVVEASPFNVVVGDEPAQKQEKPNEERARRIPIMETVRQKAQISSKPASLTDKWLAKANEGGMYAFGNDNGYSGVNSGDNDCQILQPVRVRAMIADSGTTDVPGMAMGSISDDVQGMDSVGEWCVAIPKMSVVSFQVAEAGEYATNRAPVQVDRIWMPDGFEVTVDQPAKHTDGVAGVIGKANHHTLSKTGSAIGAAFFQIASNLSRIGSFSTGDVDDPVKDMLRKKLERPSEITFSGKVVEFDLLPTSTPGY